MWILICHLATLYFTSVSEMKLYFFFYFSIYRTRKMARTISNGFRASTITCQYWHKNNNALQYIKGKGKMFNLWCVPDDNIIEIMKLKKPLSWKYVPENTRSLVNPGYCWRVDVNGDGSELTGGPLGDDKYKLEQFHCHWGCSDGKGIFFVERRRHRLKTHWMKFRFRFLLTNSGSEHTVDGLSYSGELHLGANLSFDFICLNRTWTWTSILLLQFIGIRRNIQHSKRQQPILMA